MVVYLQFWHSQGKIVKKVVKCPHCQENVAIGEPTFSIDEICFDCVLIMIILEELDW